MLWPFCEPKKQSCNQKYSTCWKALGLIIRISNCLPNSRIPNSFQDTNKYKRIDKDYITVLVKMPNKLHIISAKSNHIFCFTTKFHERKCLQCKKMLLKMYNANTNALQCLKTAVIIIVKSLAVKIWSYHSSPSAIFNFQRWAIQQNLSSWSLPDVFM